MADYRKMYLKLVIAISGAMSLLEKAILEAEEIYITEDKATHHLKVFKTDQSAEDEKKT